MKKIMTLFIVFSILIHGTTANAMTQPLSQEDRLYLINNLLAQIASLQAILQERETGIAVTGTPSITLTEPSPFMAVQYGNPYTIRWNAKNIPPKSKLLLDTKAVQLHGGTGVAGGLYVQTLAPRNTTGSRVLNTGIGYSEPGTYDVQAIVVACVDILCTKPVFTYDDVTGERIYLTKVLAKSSNVRHSITSNEQLTAVGRTITIGNITPNEGKFRLGEEMKISYYLFGDIEAGQEVCFYLHSSEGKMFSPSSNTYSACTTAKVGLNERYWTPHRKKGFSLNPGLYTVEIMVPNMPNNSGKDVGNAAEKRGGWIELLEEA